MKEARKMQGVGNGWRKLEEDNGRQSLEEKQAPPGHGKSWSTEGGLAGFDLNYSSS